MRENLWKLIASGGSAESSGSNHKFFCVRVVGDHILGVLGPQILRFSEDNIGAKVVGVLIKVSLQTDAQGRQFWLYFALSYNRN